jgi:DNA-binding CsgD family transcriptional regulator
MYVVNNWKIQDEIKRTLNLPHKYVFFTIKHMYSYVYTKIGTDAVPVIQRKLDANGLVDFFALDYEVEA